MATYAIKYYLATKHFRKCNIGSVLQLQDNVVLDIEKGKNFNIEKNLFSKFLKVPVEQVVNILKFKSHERIYALKMMLREKNEYYQKSSMTDFLNRHSHSDIKFYLIPTAYCGWKVGSIFATTNKIIFECDIRNGGVISGSIPANWIEITKENKAILIVKRRQKRLKFYNDTLKNQVWLSNTTVVLPSKSEDSMEISAIKPIVSPRAVINTQAQIQYFESTVIIPSTVFDSSTVALGGWTIGDMVYFILIESGRRYEGTLKWMGFINGVHSAAIEVSTSLSFAPLIKYRCSTNLCSRLNLNNIVNVFLVRITALHKSVANYEFMGKYFNRIFSCMGDLSLVTQIFNDAQKLKDPVFRSTLLNNCPQSFIFDLIHKSISSPSFVLSNQLSTIQELISKIPASDNCNLLKLAKTSVMAKNCELFTMLTSKCTDSDSYLDNGETFLTDLIKDNNVDKDVINFVLGKEIFDINKPNTVNESPLTLACDRLLTDSVLLLVNSKCNIDHNNNKALEVSFAAKKKALNLEQLNKVIEIIEILTTSTKLEVNICTICMDRKINVVFNCGHNSCKECAVKLSKCHLCKKAIVNWMPLFLS